MLCCFCILFPKAVSVFNDLNEADIECSLLDENKRLSVFAVFADTSESVLSFQSAFIDRETIKQRP